MNFSWKVFPFHYVYVANSSNQMLDLTERLSVKVRHFTCTITKSENIPTSFPYCKEVLGFYQVYHLDMKHKVVILCYNIQFQILCYLISYNKAQKVLHRKMFLQYYNNIAS